MVGVVIGPWDVILLPAGEGWRRLEAGEVRRCRWSNHPPCNTPATWALNRGFHRHGKVFDAWWGYCDVHLYGRVILDGELFIPVRATQSGWGAEIP